MIQIKKVRHVYPVPGGSPSIVLSFPDLSLKEGTLAAVAGPSGCGKTTLLHLIGGLLRPAVGEIWVSGAAVHQLSQRELDRFRAANVGFVFQDFNLIPSLTVEENLLLASVFAKRPRAPVKAWIDELLERVGMEEHRRRFPRQLSTGQQQRVAVARALVNRPALLLADEPTANLDAASADRVIRLLLETARETGATLLCATHDPRVLAPFAPETVIELGPPALSRDGARTAASPGGRRKEERP